MAGWANVEGSIFRPAICLVAQTLSGAENRFIAIAAQPAAAPFRVIVNRRLVELAEARPRLRPRIEAVRSAGRLIELRDPPQGWGARRSKAWYAVQVLRAVRRHGVTSLHTVLEGFGAAQLAVLTGVPAVVEVSSPDYVKVLSPHTRLKRRVLERVRHFHAVSPSVAARLEAQMREDGLDTGRIVLAPAPFFVPGSAVEPAQKERLVCYASRLMDRKNPLLFAEAAARFLDGHGEWRVAMLGQGPLLGAVREVLSRHVESGRAEVTYTDDPTSYFARSAIFVSVIQPDNYPSQSLLEAMHFGNAIVALDVGETRRLVGTDNGILIERDEEQLLRALSGLAGDAARREQLGAGSRARIRASFDAGDYIRHMLAMHPGSAGQPRPADVASTSA